MPPSPPQRGHGVQQPLVRAPQSEPPQVRKGIHPNSGSAASRGIPAQEGSIPKCVDPRRSPQVGRCTPKFWGSGRVRISPDQGSHCIPRHRAARIPKSSKGMKQMKPQSWGWENGGRRSFPRKNKKQKKGKDISVCPHPPTLTHRPGGRRSNWARLSVESQPFPKPLPQYPQGWR